MTTEMFLADVRPCTLCGKSDCKHLGGPKHNIERVYRQAGAKIDMAKIFAEWIKEQVGDPSR
jgi:hypothetical protein